MNNLAVFMCLALIPIRHNGKNYPKGAVIEMPTADSFFLKKAGYVRQATPDEIAAYQQAAQTQPSNPPLNPPNANSNSHLPPTHQVGDDNLDDNSDDKSELNSPLTQTTPDKTAEVTVADYGKLTKAELIAELSKRQIEHNPKAKNDELEALLVADDHAKTDAKLNAKTDDTAGAN